VSSQLRIPSLTASQPSLASGEVRLGQALVSDLSDYFFFFTGTSRLESPVGQPSHGD